MASSPNDPRYDDEWADSGAFGQNGHDEPESEDYPEDEFEPVEPCPSFDDVEDEDDEDEDYEDWGQFD